MIVNKLNPSPLGMTEAYSKRNPIQSSSTAPSLDVTISEQAALASRAGELQQKYVIFDTFGTEAHRRPPQPSSALEDMIYSRGGQKIDFTQKPPRWPDNNQVIDYDTWLKYEKEIDKQTETRIGIYEQSILSGLSKEEIINEIKKYNSTLGPLYYHSTEVENRPNDIERESYKLPPPGTYHPNIVATRDVAYQEMISAMANVRKTLGAYSTSK